MIEKLNIIKSFGSLITIIKYMVIQSYLQWNLLLLNLYPIKSETLTVLTGENNLNIKLDI